MEFDAIHVLAVLTPFLLLPFAGVLGGRNPRYARLLAVAPAALTGYFAYLFTIVADAGPFTATAPWAASFGLTLAFHFDGLGLLFALLITGIGALIVLYGSAYLEGHPHAGRFQVMLFAFMGSMLGVVLSDNILLLFVFWELTGITSYLLIGFEHEKLQARRAAMQALLVTGAGGLALLAAGVVISQITGTASLSALRASETVLAGHPAYAVLVGLVLFAAFTKSAQFPFHFWLPNAMAAPTPVSGYLHSATMVKAGVYLVARMTLPLGGTALWTGVIAVVGALTMVGAAYRSLLETDLKRILAYTTVSALGAMMLSLSLGTPAAVAAGIVYLVAHACYKGALFLVAGAIDHGTGSRDVRELAGLGRVMPITAVAGVLAALSMAGIPPLLGFIAKEGFYTALGEITVFQFAPAVFVAAAVAGSAMLGAAGLSAGIGPFVGGAPRPEGAHEPVPGLWLGPLILALVGLVAGIAPALAEAPLTFAAAAVTGGIASMDLALWHGVTPALLLSAVTLALTLTLYRYRNEIRDRVPTPGTGAEWIYSTTLRGVDAISRKIAPALQSASLRSYVRVIVITSVVLIVSGLILSGDLPATERWTPAQPHEVGVALLIVVAALSAALARSTMAAVLSLGGVGYGIALLYVLFSAPDLAATQFAVETLTVVIFVLVFYQFPTMEESAIWRGRDALIAGAAGTSIALLVLVTAGSGTTSRLADYFIDAAPRLAHGLNIVNVILVDFRAFDTMGEITVLVTVAIGVRALLQIGREGRP